MGYSVRQKPPTESTEITVAYVNERKEGQFSASIKDTKGDLYWIEESKLHLFKVGERYDIEFSVRQSKNGFISRTIEVIRHLTPHGHQPKDTSESSEERAAAKVANAVKQASPPQQSTSAPRAIAYNNNPGAAVMGMVNQYVGRGDVPLNRDEIARAIDECLAGYLKSKLGEAA
jgi:hypothetical protein